jgi:hypothetical protein
MEPMVAARVAASLIAAWAAKDAVADSAAAFGITIVVAADVAVDEGVVHIVEAGEGVVVDRVSYESATMAVQPHRTRAVTVPTQSLRTQPRVPSGQPAVDMLCMVRWHMVALQGLQVRMCDLYLLS